jgi:AraC family transcriptional regulator
MVCQRCILSVENIIKNLNIRQAKVDLGRIILQVELDAKLFKQLLHNIELVGFEVITSKEEITIEKVKNIIRDIVESKNIKNTVVSSIITSELGINHSKISKLFSTSEGKTIEKYLIEVKIEKVKELIKYNELSISEISYELNYSSPQHLARQFKQITGMTSSEFKLNGERLELDKI